MTDTTSVNATKNAGAKPRLSLLSYKQSCTTLKSEDNTSDQEDGDLFASNDSLRGDRQTTSNLTNNLDQTGSRDVIPAAQYVPKANATEIFLQNPYCPNVALKEANTNLDQGKQRSVDKLNVSKEDLIALLSMLKSELQSKEIALASIKLEQLKRLMNPVEISKSSLAQTYIELQNRLHSKDQQNGGNNRGETHKESTDLSRLSASEIETFDEKGTKGLANKVMFKSHHQHIDNDESDKETIDILSTLLELLDRHPLLALPRDSMYCLDYNCNELSTKNYLNLKIQHLENLIEQHRKFRYLIGEKLKRSEQRSIDLALKLEFERNMRIKNDTSAYCNTGKTVLLQHIEKLKDDIEKEKAGKHAIVMTLLNELLDERERNEILSEKVLELEKRLTGVDKAQQQSSISQPISQQIVSKPRVPAKPAQLLDRQRSQSNNK